MDEAKGKLHVLLITRNFPPLTGGMERLVLNAARGMAEWADLTIIGPRGCAAHSPEGAKVYETATELAPFLLLSTMHAMKACRREKFHLVVGGSGLVAPTLTLLQKIYGLHTAVFIHGLDLVVDSRIYQALFVPCIRRASLVISNSSSTRNTAVKKRVRAERITILNPGTQVPDIAKIEHRETFCHRHNIPFRKIILFVGRMTRRKGLSRFIEQSLPTILEHIPGSGLIVVGDDPKQGLTSFGEQEKILEIVERSQLKQDIIFLGGVSDDDLDACYAMADVQIFPLIEVPGDVEGFGMVAIEAAACGTPTVAFRVGGVEDAISEKNGFLCSPGDYESFSSRVTQIIQTGEPKPVDCISHAQKYEWHKYNSSLRAALTSVVPSR